MRISKRCLIVFHSSVSLLSERPAEDVGRYAPPNFVNNALRHTHQFGLSWDETPAERRQWLESLAEVDDINDDWQEEHCPELSRYLAMSDSSDDEEEEEKERKRQVIRSLLQEADKAEEKRKRRQQRGLRKGDDSDSESDSEEGDGSEKRESSEEEKEAAAILEREEERMEEEENEEEEEKMETSGESEVEPAFDDDKNFFKMVAQKRDEKFKEKEKKRITKDVTEETSDEDLLFGLGKTVNKKSEHHRKEKTKVNEEKEKVGKRKRKRLTKQQKAREKMKEKERPVDPELSLLMSNFKRTAKKTKQLVS